MAFFENIVRPFQTPQTSPGLRVYAPVIQPPPVRFTANGPAGGSIKTFGGSYSSRTTSYNPKQSREATLAEA